MTYVLIAAMPDGALQDTAGNARLDPVEFRLVNGTAPNHYDGTLVSHYADAAGTGPSTAAITPDSRGRLMRYIAGGYYKQIVNPAEPTRRESLDFHAFSGSDAPYTLEAAGVTSERTRPRCSTPLRRPRARTAGSSRAPRAGS
jgi:hypothetical protein